MGGEGGEKRRGEGRKSKKEGGREGKSLPFYNLGGSRTSTFTTVRESSSFGPQARNQSTGSNQHNDEGTGSPIPNL